MTSIDDGPVSPSIERWTARRVMEQHADAYPGGTVRQPDRVSGRCAQCQDQGCGMLDWARRVLTSNVPRFPATR